MSTITVKGHEFKSFNPRDCNTRRAIQYKNSIIAAFKKIGAHEDDVEVPVAAIAIKRMQASVQVYLDGEYIYFSYNKSKFGENIYVVCKVIEAEVQQILEGTKTKQQFIDEYMEDFDIEKKRKEANRPQRIRSSP